MKTLEKAFKIIDLIDEYKELKFNDVIRLTAFKKSTVHRFLSSLIKNKYITKDKLTSNYKLGLKFLNVSSKILLNLDIRERAELYLNELNSITGETVHLAMLIDDEVVYIDKKESNKSIRLISRVGKVAQMYCTAVGKAILAFQTKSFIEKKLNIIEFIKFTKNTIVKKEELLLELKKVKEQGFSLDQEENEERICCIAAPIKDYTGRVIASMSISVARIGTDIKELLNHKELLLEKTKLISENLGMPKK
ncbi:MAG: IclR family transcriptional regulator [Actinobacteria bacterium]|nr:IclR family transcriptional regulator [Actinomycetota bacterium]